MTDDAYAAQVAEVERDREGVRRYFRHMHGAVLGVVEANICRFFPLPEKPKKLREVKAFALQYRYRNGVLEEHAWDGWKRSSYQIEHYAAVASLATHPYEEEAP